ncbi:MAG: flagellar hook-basal body complex protein [Alphaproteobacteria bacterium]|nr:flagellar hook-basal body complex protein [Alphaproteobacteria bacterium]
MSINSGLFSGVAAVAAQSTNFAIISDNIANTNTVGYKETEGRFRILVTRSPSSISFTAGGVVAQPLSDPQQQGLLQGTTSSTDISIDGNGFFITNEAQTPGTSDEYFMTRAGSFVPNENGRLANTAGYFLQGWVTDTSGNIQNAATRDLLTSLETVNLSQFGQVANPTTTATVNVNLNSNRTLNQADTTNLTVFDSEDNDYLMGIQFSRTAANTFNYTYSLTDVASGLAVGAIATRQMIFNTDGSLNSLNGTAGTTNAAALDTTITFAAATVTGAIADRAVNDISIQVNFGNFDQATGTSQFDVAFAPSLLNQDGSGPSALTSTTIDDTGLLTAQFANGQNRAIYRIPIGTIPAPTQLETVSGNAYRTTATSGDLVLNIAQQGGSGRMQSPALENSTVDIAEQFTDLIITQRAYSAATKIITTGDELLEEIIRVKR